MPSLEEFRQLLHDGDSEQAFSNYELDFNSEAFDAFGSGAVSGYEVDIEWTFESPNKIKMERALTSGKKIYYLPWASKDVTTITLDGDSPAYFVTSHFSNCRFTSKFHDDQGKKVTVMHVAGDTGGGGTVEGSQQRDALESSVTVENVTRTRRLSISNQKVGRKGKLHMAKGIQAGTSYYDSYARVFGVRRGNGNWVFYTQDFNQRGQILGFSTL